MNRRPFLTLLACSTSLAAAVLWPAAAHAQAALDTVLAKKQITIAIPTDFPPYGFVGTDLTTMWRWLRTHEIALDTGPARAVHPEARTVTSWLRAQRPTRPAR